MRILFIITFLMCFFCIFLIYKSEERLNGAVWLVLSLIGEICFGAVIVGIIAAFSIPTTLASLSFVYFIIGCLCWVYILKLKKIQKYQWQMWDLCCMAVLAVVVAAVCAENYDGIALKFVFWNSDPAVHFQTAMRVIRQHKITGMYFAPLYAGTLIDLLSPLVHAVNYYKIYIIADCLVSIMQILVFYVLICDSLTTWKRRAVGVLISILYLGGYPLVNFYQGFFYWGIGVTLIAFLLYMVRCYWENRIQRNVCILFLMGGCAGVVLCYMLFAPFVYIAVFLSLAVVAKQEGKLVTYQNLMIMLKVFLLPCILGLYYCYFQFFAGSSNTVSRTINNISKSMNMEGSIYRELYSNFLLLLPLVIYWMISRTKEKRLREREIFLLVNVIFILLLFIAACEEKVSSYYYYKLYYPLWLLLFSILPSVLFELYAKCKTLLLSHAAVALFLAVMSFWKIEDKIIENHTLQLANRSEQFFDIYHFNRDLFGASDGIYNHKMLELCEFVMEENMKDENIPIVTSVDAYGYWYWYDAITGNDSLMHSYAWVEPWDRYKEILKEEDCKYVIVVNDAEVYRSHIKFWSAFDCVKENEFGKY